MDFLVDSVRRLSGSRSKSRSLPLYTRPPGANPRLAGAWDEPTPSGGQSAMEKRISCSSPKLAWSSQDQPLVQKRRNSSCLPGQRSDSDGSPSDTTSCSSVEFLPTSSYRVQPAAFSDQGQKASSDIRKGRLDAMKARVTAQRNKYKEDSSSDEEKPAQASPGLSRFHSDEALNRNRNRYSRKGRLAKRRSQDLEALTRSPVTRSDPQLPFDPRAPVSWNESSAYQEPSSQHTDTQSASEDTPLPIRKAVVARPLVQRSVAPAVRKPLTISIHGLSGHFPPASPCDSGLGSHSMTSSPSLGRAPTPPLRSPKADSVPRLPPSINSVATHSDSSVWWRKKQPLPTQGFRPESPSGARVYAYTDQAPRTSAYLSFAQPETRKHTSEEFSKKLGAWKAIESGRDEGAPKPQRPWKESSEPTRDVPSRPPKTDPLVEVCRSQRVVWPKDFSNGVSRSPVVDNSPRHSPITWAKTVTSPQKTWPPGKTETSDITPRPSKLWSTPVPARNPNRISAAEALGVTAAIPPPPTRVASLDTARRSVDALVDRERRRRCSEHLEDALQELETIYQSLKLNEDDELLDRAERRDMPEFRPAFKGPARWQKRYSIADPTGGFPLARSFSDTPTRLRRSAVPDKVADDLAVRKLQQPATPTRSKVPIEASSSPSYLLCSPAFTPTLSVQPATRDVTCTNEPDPELDDVGYRKFIQSHRHLPPHPPFGIPLEPSPKSPLSSYIYTDHTFQAPDWRSSKKNVQPDLLRDDLAFRNLRRSSLLESGSRASVSVLSEDWTRPAGLGEKEDSMASIIAALEGLGQRSPPPVPKRRSMTSGQKRVHGLTLQA